MSHAGAPTNLNNNPAIRKLESKVHNLEKKLDADREVFEDLQNTVKSLEGKVSLLLRKLGTAGTPARTDHKPAYEEPAMTFAPIKMPAVVDDGGQMRVVEVDTGAAFTPADDNLTIGKIDAYLSNLGIRLVQIDDDTCDLEPMNAFGSENLRSLGTHAPLAQVEQFVREHGHLA